MVFFPRLFEACSVALLTRSLFFCAGTTTSLPLPLLLTLHPIHLSVVITSRSELSQVSSMDAEQLPPPLVFSPLVRCRVHLDGVRSGFSLWDALPLEQLSWERKLWRSFFRNQKCIRRDDIFISNQDLIANFEFFDRSHVKLRFGRMCFP